MITNIKKYPLWPEPQFSLTDLMMGSVPSITEIEKFFEDIYPNTYAVLMPSGRSCISLILQYLEIKRPDLVYIRLIAVIVSSIPLGTLALHLLN